VTPSLLVYLANSLTVLFIEDHEPSWAFRIVRDWVLGGVCRSHPPQACGSSAAQQAKEQLTMAIKKRKRMTFEKSSGNVFADIGLANPERAQLKAHLTLRIYRIIDDETKLVELGKSAC